MITHLLVDYGEVISQPQPARVLPDLARLSGLPTAELSRRYWHHRPDYDRGQASLNYWSTVLRRSFAPDEPLLEDLVATDIGGWLHLNSATLQILFDQAQYGTHLALLSNAPHPQADAMDRSSWAHLFAHRLYSCRLGVAKPDPSIFERALDTIGAAPEQTLFIDDLASNTEAAAQLGLRTLTFSSPAALAATLEDHWPSPQLDTTG
ncbi:MAG TPA: HAD family phosphatase [Acidimicrobiales bacterium]|jgi:putative hydrolase of the HAD superfamily|nr:HAD family phosphatase [Acidimicrobiales bacterium]